MSEMNTKVVKKVKIEEQGNDFQYWQSRSYESRLEALESIRAEFNNWKYHDQQRFQRIYRVIKQE